MINCPIRVISDDWMMTDFLEHLSWNRPLCGFLSLSLSAVAGGLGNSLEPVSALAFIHIFLLVYGFEVASTWLNAKWRLKLFAILSFIWLTQAGGFCLGFSSIFGYPKSTPASVAMSFALGLALWIAIIILAVIPHYCFHIRFSGSVTFPLVFPVCYTMVNHAVIGPVLSTFPSLGNAVVDIAPLRQFAALFGIAGITFMVTSISTSLALSVTQHRSVKNITRIVLFASVTAMVVTGFMIYADIFYQKDVSHQIYPSVSVSCVFAQTAPRGSADRAATWNSTQSRIDAGDAIVMWAEEMFLIESEDDEAEVLLQAQSMARGGDSGTFLAITYLKQLPGHPLATNQFALITPEGDVAWNYLKAHPVPGVEDGVQAGPDVLPVYRSSSLGVLGGGICFDLDFPSYISQAGAAKVDVFLQPSWTWGAISSRHFDGDAVRAVENGFNLFRCSSEGESGIVDPRGRVSSRKFTGADPTETTVFELPLHPRVETFYTVVGFVFQWVLVAAAAGIYLVVVLPSRWVDPMLERVWSPCSSSQMQAGGSSAGHSYDTFKHGSDGSDGEQPFIQ